MRSMDPRVWPRLGLFALLGTASALGCGSIAPVEPYENPVTDPTQLYMRLTLDYPAVTLSTASPYATLQLTATPLNALGAPMPGLPDPAFHLMNQADTMRVRVTPDGLVTAVRPTFGEGTKVIAELTVGSVRYADTALIVVTNLMSPPKLASLSIHPVSPDSAVWSFRPTYSSSVVGSSGQSLADQVFYFASSLLPLEHLTPQALDSTGNAMPSLPIDYVSLDPEIATVDRQTGGVKLIRTGQVRMVARTIAYGIAKADTALFTVTTPAFATVTAYRKDNGVLDFSPSQVRVRPNGFVNFANLLDDSVDVIFEGPGDVVRPPALLCDWYEVFLAFVFGPDPVHCGAGEVRLPPKGPSVDIGGGNFTDGSEATIQIRQFSTPGTYTFHSTRTGASGRLEVTMYYDYN